MGAVIASHELITSGLQLESLSVEAARVTLLTKSCKSKALCSVCSSDSSRVHSRYLRTVFDLAWYGVCVKLKIRVRRFFCDELLARSCPRSLLAPVRPARLEEALLRDRPRARRQGRR
jgi:transposase IS204/IS1001/IS1096/IS1165 family protein